MDERHIAKNLKARIRRVVRHVFALGEHGLSDLGRPGGHGGFGAVCAFVLPIALHTATAGNDVLALLAVTGLKPEAHLTYLVEAVFTALVWIGHVRGGE